EEITPTPNYWCTWGAQNYGADNVDLYTWNGPYNNLNQQILFEDPGWATRFFRQARSDLYVMFDVGWDTAAGIAIEEERWRLGSLVVDSDRFPDCSGSPPERLACLNRLCWEAGWRGAAIWVAPQVAGLEEPEAMADHRAYWEERARWSREAGIDYWKVDVGRHAGEVAYRRMMTEVCREVYPELMLEHAVNLGPLNDEPTPWSEMAGGGSGRYRNWDEGGVRACALEILDFADVFRTYDVTAHLSAATTIDRLAELLGGAPHNPSGRALLNAEDEVYLAAALGCTIGVMRHAAWRDHEIDYDPHGWRHSLDEVLRAVRWQRLAPAVGAHTLPVTVSKRILTDSWRFHEGDTWAHFYWGERYEQAAPAVVARGMPLPEVQRGPGDGGPEDLPFVVASRHLQGPVSVATLPRTDEERGIYHPRAHVSLSLTDLSAPVAVFGHYASLRLALPAGEGQPRVWAQDLGGDAAVEITGRLSEEEGHLVLPGAVIEEAGLAAATPGDRSAPGLVLSFVAESA
ncbi:MAG TPA: hypothetical protein VK879_16455, partial [Candidatus Sulfomarinibacteraceae bacterium]|nr:hypothetical protein [Candidatus Sulfomarinibacteraceae bacterium]